METLQYANNLVRLQPTSSRLLTNNRSKNWLNISPREVLLQGMLLTGNFNIQNQHQHLSVNFRVKSLLKGQEQPFLEVFPQKGSIMRGQIKKFRVKFTRQFKPQLSDNGSMCLKIHVNLNTEWNKQYMITNKFKGWNEIKDLPIQQYEIPILISDEYQDIKQNIRNSVLFESEFGKVSQDFSSLYGDQKFQIPQVDQHKSHNRVRMSRDGARYSELEPFYQKKISNSEKKGSRSSIHGHSPKKEVFFGHAPKMVQSKLELESSIRRSRAESVKKEYHSRDLGILEINTPIKNKQVFEVPKPKQSPQMLNPFNNGGNLFKSFSNERLPSGQKILPNFNRDDSQMSILKSLEPRNSEVHQYKFEEEYQNRSTSKEESNFKDFKTVVENNFQSEGGNYTANKRSMELIVLAIIAGFFVALGSNIANLFT